MSNRVTTASAFSWIKLGCQNVLRQPFGFIGTVFAYLYCVYLISSVPFIGWLLYGMLLPFLILAVARGARQAAEGTVINLDIFTEGWQDRDTLWRLLLLGAIISLLQLAIAALGYFAAQSSTRLMMGVVILLSAIAAMFWVFSPMLIAWKGLSVRDALLESFGACRRNLVSIAVFGALIVAILVAFGIAMLVVSYILRIDAGIGVLPLYTLPSSVLFASIWPMWQELFADDEGEEPEDEPAPALPAADGAPAAGADPAKED